MKLIGRLQEAFQEAILRSCGPVYASMTASNKKMIVQAAKNWRKFGDFQSKVAETIFRTHLATVAGVETTAMVVTTESAYGWERERRYETSRELALEIIACIPETAMVDVLADVVIEGSGSILMITTAPHMAWHINNDRHPCNVCGRFCQGAFGLRTHMVEMHGIEAQMIVYVPPRPLQLSPSDNLEADCVCRSHIENVEVDSSRSDYSTSERCKAVLTAAKGGNLTLLQSLVELSSTNGHMLESGRPAASTIDMNTIADADGNTALTWAAGNGYLAVCQYLVDRLGMNPRVAVGRKKRHRQPIHWAARNGHTHICEWLVKDHGVDIDATTENGTTPLHFAIWMGQHECVSWLVEVGGCDVNRRNNFGCNATHWAGFKGDVSILKYMHAKGLDYMHINHNRRSAIHKAAVKGNFEACEWLLAPLKDGGGGLGIQQMQPELEGDSPITLAFSMGHYELQRFLAERYEELSCNLDQQEVSLRKRDQTPEGGVESSN